jgi:phosphatidylinositol kinase/protein kinase (PI-3  family)
MSAMSSSIIGSGHGTLASVRNRDRSTTIGTSIISSVHRYGRERELVHALGPEGEMAPQDALNERALAVIRRVQAKLSGRDFSTESELAVPAQVQRLIRQAESHENLCQCYIGWCPFW